MSWLLMILNSTNAKPKTTTPLLAAMETAIAVSTLSTTPHPTLDGALSMPWGWRETKTPEATWDSENNVKVASSFLNPITPAQT